jgi:hypothetical protein
MRMPGFTATPMLPIGRADEYNWGCSCFCGLICKEGSTDICWLGCRCVCLGIGPVIIKPT